MIYDVIIVGAGASGLCVAYQIKSICSQANVLILEKANNIGKKLSASGNGKCNLTNVDFGIAHYFSQSRESLSKWMSCFSHRNIVDFFEKMGILLYEKEGYFYPLSNQAKQVTEYIRASCLSFGTHIMLENKVTHVKKEEAYYIVSAVHQEKKTEYKAKYVVLATGGAASPQLGGTMDGYHLTKELGMCVIPPFPVLTPAFVEDVNLKYAKGVRLDVCISLREKNGILKKEYGQLQINEDSLSGIAMMNLSCLFNQFGEEERKDCLYIDVMPNYSWNELRDIIEGFCMTQKNQSISHILSGILPNKFVIYILKRLNLKDSLKASEVTEKMMNRMVSLLKKMPFTPMERLEFERAQVTGGGVSCEEIVFDSFECKKKKGIFVVGELLDVTGECGGYNLSFALLSGICAGSYIGEILVGKDKMNDRN